MFAGRADSGTRAAMCSSTLDGGSFALAGTISMSSEGARSEGAEDSSTGIDTNAEAVGTSEKLSAADEEEAACNESLEEAAGAEEKDEGAESTCIASTPFQIGRAHV